MLLSKLDIGVSGGDILNPKRYRKIKRIVKYAKLYTEDDLNKCSVEDLSMLEKKLFVGLQLKILFKNRHNN